MGVFEGSGGPAPHACQLRPELFAASAMVKVHKDLMAMTVAQLKEELEARGQPKSGALKAVLRQRLCTAIVSRHSQAAAAAAAAAAAGASRGGAPKRQKR